jgi:hypothetical protein
VTPLDAAPQDTITSGATKPNLRLVN